MSCRIPLHDIFDRIRGDIEAFERTGLTVAVNCPDGKPLNQVYPGIFDEAAVVIFLNEQDERRALTVMSDQRVLQVMTNWLVKPGYSLGYDDLLGAVVVNKPSS